VLVAIGVWPDFVVGGEMFSRKFGFPKSSTSPPTFPLSNKPYSIYLPRLKSSLLEG